MRVMAGSLATVLICDDEPSLRELIRVSLVGPYRFAEADDGEESLVIARRLRPDVVILVTGDADFAYLAIRLRRHGIRVEVASVAQNLGQTLKSAANTVIDLAPLFRTFEMIKMQDAKSPTAPGPTRQGQARRRPRFRSV